MKKILLTIFLLAMLTAGCSTGQNAASEGSTASGTDSTSAYDKQSASKTLDGEIKFYPTYDAEYKTGSNEIFGFWFDIPKAWKAVDQSKDGGEYTIFPGNDKVGLKLYGELAKGSEENFYASLAGAGGTVSDFTYRDGWIGKKIDVSEQETYYVRLDGDSYMIFHVNAANDAEWKKQNEEKLNYIAMSERTTRESYGAGLDGENSVTPDDLQLGKIKLEMSYDELIKAIGQKPQSEQEEEYEGSQAKTLFFADNTQVFLVENRVCSVNATSPGYVTPKGLKPGDSADRVIELYGEPSNKGDDNYWGYTYNGYEVFTVLIEKDKVAEIQIDMAM